MFNGRRAAGWPLAVLSTSIWQELIVLSGQDISRRAGFRQVVAQVSCLVEFRIVQSRRVQSRHGMSVKLCSVRLCFVTANGSRQVQLGHEGLCRVSPSHGKCVKSNRVMSSLASYCKVMAR